MNLIATLAPVVAPVFLIAAGGYAWARAGQPFDHALVTRLIAAIGAPALVFATMANMALPLGAAAQMASATAICLLATAAAAAAILRLSNMPMRVYLPSLTFPNIGNAGLPVCLFAFGQEGMTLAMVFFAVTSVGQFSLGPAIAAGKLDLGKLLRVPLLHAVAAAVAVKAIGWTVPLWAMNTLNLLSGLTIPLMLLSLGVALGELKAANLSRAVAMSALRLALGAALGFATAAAFGLDGAARGVVVIESAMPAAVFNYLFARMYDNRPDEVAGVILVSTVMSAVTLPVILTWVM
jgi:malate permease and related proteins